MFMFRNTQFSDIPNASHGLPRWCQLHDMIDSWYKRETSLLEHPEFPREDWPSHEDYRRLMSGEGPKELNKVLRELREKGHVAFVRWWKLDRIRSRRLWKLKMRRDYLRYKLDCLRERNHASWPLS